MRLLGFQHSHQGVQAIPGGGAGLELTANPLHRLRYPLLVKGLEQVVNRIDLEGLNRILVVGSSKHDLGQGHFLIQ